MNTTQEVACLRTYRVDQKVRCISEIQQKENTNKIHYKKITI